MKTKRILIGLLLFCSMTACKKSFLDVDNTTEPYRQNYVKDLNTMGQFMNGIYIILSDNYEHGIGAAYPELVADNLKPLATGTQSLLKHYTWSQQAVDNPEYSAAVSSSSMNGSWTTGYQIIHASSFVIEDADKYRNENPVKADQIKGEAYGIRAMVHFKLVNIFAQPYLFTANASHPGIPYITTSNITESYSRQSVAEVYDGIINDLTAAIQLLPADIKDTRYMNQAAARALLARAYLFTGDCIKATSLAKEISAKFPLLTTGNGYPNGLFKDKKPYESEVLFRLTPLPAVGSNFIGRYLRGTGVRYRATNDIVDIIRENPNDARYTWVTSAGSGIWNANKFPSASTPEITPVVNPVESAYYPPVIRSSEMFLTVAEAAAKTGDEPTARTYLNAIRERANPAIAPVVATGQALLDSIYKERRKELAFEGLRMYDLQRWGLGVHRIDAPVTAKDLPYPGEKAISPIPLRDVKLTGIPQNPGY